MVHRFIVLLTLILLVVLAWDSVYAENKVLSLDGDGDYVRIPASVWFNGDLSIEAWVYVKEYTPWSRVIDFGNGADNVLVRLSRGTTGIPDFYIVESGWMGIECSTALELNSWTHIACTLKGNSGSLFINGHAVGKEIFASPPRDVERQNNFIGRSNWKINDDSHAMFDEIRIWNVSRSATEIQGAMNTSLSGDEKGLLGYWNFNDGTAKDLTPNGNDGEMKGDAQIVNLNDLPRWRKL
ncbi:TPA: LamG domain-containing protein [Candidatus Poribacteria bacterium]|nr:LamG domain-containing protein [Candidatus Poribacteria bacterium]HIO46855.1 LamG domain-containing protein [Candidatus Poribacteria bacterium]